VDDRVGQPPAAAAANERYFLEGDSAYRDAIATIDSYRAIHRAVTTAIEGVDDLLDIGNGGVFDYDTSVVRAITGIDLAVDSLPLEGRPENVTMIAGDALSLPRPDAAHDGVLMVMLLHHLVGRTWRDCAANLDRAIAEAARVLRPGGRLVIVESCVPGWFQQIEKLLYRPSRAVIERLITHPPTFQFTADAVAQTIERHCGGEPRIDRIPLGRFVLQYGVKFPTALTPVRAIRFVAQKAG
jgi:SAM-dependent methyltransferase